MTLPATCELKYNYYDVLLHIIANSVMILFCLLSMIKKYNGPENISPAILDPEINNYGL
jgi:hypothetical protein